MSAPILWIILPLLVAIVLFLLQAQIRKVTWIAAIFCFFLGLVAFLQPIDSVLQIGPLSVNLTSSLTFLGRGFYLDNGDRFFLAVLYFAACFWLIGSLSARVTGMFVPVGLAICAVLTGALAVEPFLYSAVLVELAILLVIPLMVKKGSAVGNGVIRFMIFQSLAMPFILFAGWLLSGSSASVSDEQQLIQASVILGIGFAFWLAIFPFHTWIPMLMQENHPYVVGFILSIQPVVILILMVDFLNGFVWLRDTAVLYTVLQTVGTVMVVMGGVWAAFLKDVRRLFGFAVIIENGFALVAVGLKSDSALRLLYSSFIPRLTALAVMALALSLAATRVQSLEYSTLKGFARKYPIISAAILVSAYSLMGLPTFASFPTRLGIMEITSTTSLSVFVWLMVGLLGFFLAITRLLSYLFENVHQKWTLGEKPVEIILLVVGMLFLAYMGLFPRQISGITAELLANIAFLQ